MIECLDALSTNDDQTGFNSSRKQRILEELRIHILQAMPICQRSKQPEIQIQYNNTKISLIIVYCIINLFIDPHIITYNMVIMAASPYICLDLKFHLIVNMLTKTRTLCLAQGTILSYTGLSPCLATLWPPGHTTHTIYTIYIYLINREEMEEYVPTNNISVINQILILSMLPKIS